LYNAENSLLKMQQLAVYIQFPALCMGSARCFFSKSVLLMSKKVQQRNEAAALERVSEIETSLM
jgi:hypothetical protein